MDDNNLLTLEQLMEKVDQMKKQDRMDLSSDLDLSVALMNLDFFFTGVKTGKDSYSMRVMEVGTKQLTLGNKDEAKDLFEKGLCALLPLLCGQYERRRRRPSEKNRRSSAQ